MTEDHRIGTEIAGFRIQEELGRGGMGVVYLAEQSSPRRRVALKILSPELARDPVFRERFTRESEAAASVEHPNVVPVHASGESDGVLYIAMRYVQGEDLATLIHRDGPLPSGRAVSICSQIAEALDEAHETGLVHRDVKPGNILVAKGDRAYLSDFGLIRRSKLETGLTRTGQFMGTIDYCAPEQIRGEEVDGRADVYSLGCVLYECLAGAPPFTRESEIATLYAHLEESPPPTTSSPSGPSRELDRVIAVAMAKRPDDRYATSSEFARAARHALGIGSGEGEAVAERPPARRRRLLVAAGGLLVLAAIAVFLATRGGPTPERTTHAPPGPPLGSVVRLDPATGKLAQTISGISVTVNSTESLLGLAAGEGGVWVGNNPNVQHIDPVSGTVSGTIFVQSIFAQPVVGFRTVWLLSTGGDELLRINPATDALLPSVRLTPPGTAGFGHHVAVGEGAVWVSLGIDSIVEVDPIRNEVIRRIDTGAVDGIAAGAGGVWVIDTLSGRLTEIDPTSGKIVGSIDVSGSPDAITVGGGSVWLLDQGVGTVLEIDAATLIPGDTIRLGSDETDITFGAGAVWLADGTGNSLTRIDPVTHEPRIFSVGSPVLRVAVDTDSGDVWGLIAKPA
ncbi:MAG: protein kinase [Actinomycetota bacterium]|nr:protein kinase [Actinomycetota bacterium]